MFRIAVDHGDNALDLDPHPAQSCHDNAPDTDPHPAQSYQGGDIRVEYHPHSGCRTKIFKPDEYRQSVRDTDATVEREPWVPFRTREDFEFSEIALETMMTRKQTDAMIKLFHKCIEMGEGSFTISNHKDMEDTLKVAANRLTKVQ